MGHRLSYDGSGNLLCYYNGKRYIIWRNKNYLAWDCRIRDNPKIAYPEGVTPPPGESGADKKQNQSHTMTYDSFGNRKTIAVGTRTLMRNTYAAKNGQLTQQAYGNGDTVSFTYDSLGRTIQTNYSDGRTLDYTYNMVQILMLVDFK